MSIRRKANGRYEVRWTEGGKRHGRTFDRKSDAAAFELDARRRRQLGGLLVPDLDVTLAEFCAEWWLLHVVPNLAAQTQLNYAWLRDKHVLPRLGNYRLTEISPRLVNRYRAELLVDGVGPPTVRKALAVLQSMLAMAEQEERIASNPVAKIRKPSQLPARRADPLSPYTVERLRRELGMRDATLVSVLAYAGLRPGEALALRWNRVGERSISVESSIALGKETRTKTGRARTVRLLGPLAQDLSEWREAGSRSGSCELVFPRADGSPWVPDDWKRWRRRIFQPASRRIGLQGARPYDLRSSFVSLLIAEGRTVLDVAMQAGHGAETCLRHYARLFAEQDLDQRASAEDQISSARRRVRGVDPGRGLDADADS